MADTIESFVAKLKQEGVEEGRRQAERLISDARQQAEKIVSDAQVQADKIIADAKAEAEGILARGRTDLELAARDATLKLREALESTLEMILSARVEVQLNDAEFLKKTIQAILERFIESNIDSHTPVKINVTPEMRQQLSDWAVTELREIMKDNAGGVTLRDNLRQAGFEFSLHGATIEVTRDSVVETLMQLVSPTLRQILAQAHSSEEGS